VVLEDSALVGILFKPSGLPWKEEFSWFLSGLIQSAFAIQVYFFDQEVYKLLYIRELW
jgi:hypothetical protein